MVYAITVGSLLFTGLLMVGLAMPLMQGAIDRNAVYGIRIRKSFISPEHWRRINMVGGRNFTHAGIAVMLMSPLCLLADQLMPVSYTLLATLPSLVAIAWAVYATMRYADSLPDEPFNTAD